MAESGNEQTTWEQAVEAATNIVGGIDAARGEISAEKLREVQSALDRLVAARADVPSRPEHDEGDDELTAALFARAAALAIARDEEALAIRWLEVAVEHVHDAETREELLAAQASHERYRQLVYGRQLSADFHTHAARTNWQLVCKGPPDAIARAAKRELDAPRPLGPNDEPPTLHNIYGIGNQFFGQRDRWADNSYATTNCFTIIGIPVFPLNAWRVRDLYDGGYQVFAREQLSPFARKARFALPSVIVLAIAIGVLSAHLNDPVRRATQRWDAALAAVQHAPREVGLQRLDTALANDLSLVDGARAERAGAEVVRLAAAGVASPFSADSVDQALRVVSRYRGLPGRAQDGPAHAAMLAQLERWIAALGDGNETADARLALLRPAAQLAWAEQGERLRAQITATTLALAATKQADWPIEALGVLMGGTPSRAEIEAADAIVARLCDSPSLLADASDELEIWRANTASAELRTRTAELREAADKARVAAEAEGITDKQLTALLAVHPWNQHAVLALASNAASAGKIEAAEARLAALGPDGVVVRAARLARAQLAAGLGKLEAADQQLTALLRGRLPRFTAESAAAEQLTKTIVDRLKARLESGDVPFELQQQVDRAEEQERMGIVRQWLIKQVESDAALTAVRARYVALSDVVPIAVAAGSVKLRRAQALTGAARNAMLEDAERTFLAIRSDAEDQPSFRLALGEIYARLGKHTESEAELSAVLAKNDSELSLNVANVYRSLGSIARAKQVAETVHTNGAREDRESAAMMLAVMARDDDEAALWYRRADANSPEVKAALLDVEGRQLARQDKPAECAAKFAAAARAYLALTAANLDDSSGYNNAAISLKQGFDCNSDPKALRDAEAALEKAYRSAPESPVVLSNLSQMLDSNNDVRVVSRHVDIRALRLTLDDIEELARALSQGPERAAVVADRVGGAGARRAEQLSIQVAVLAPNSARVYAMRFAQARLRRDADGAAAIVDQARRAANLDLSVLAEQRASWLSGEGDAKLLDESQAAITRLTTALAGAGARLPAKTRAAGWYLLADKLSWVGLHTNDKAVLARARDAAMQATQLWPALDANAHVIATWLDEAGLAADAKAWRAGRRERPATSLLDKLLRDSDPLGAQVRASVRWPDIIARAKADASERVLSDLRLARLAADPELEQRAKTVLDDPFLRLQLELTTVLSPDDTDAKDDLAYLAKR